MTFLIALMLNLPQPEWAPRVTFIRRAGRRPSAAAVTLPQSGVRFALACELDQDKAAVLVGWGTPHDFAECWADYGVRWAVVRPDRRRVLTLRLPVQFFVYDDDGTINVYVQRQDFTIVGKKE